MTAFMNPGLDNDRQRVASRAIPWVDTGARVEAQLRRSGYLALQDVSCDVHSGSARLVGQVPSYYLKQIAQETAGEVEGVRTVLNELVVVPRGRRSPTGHDRTSAAVRSDRVGH